MKLEKIFENDSFIIWQDNKGWDFAYDIENKTNKEITICLNDCDEEYTINKWLGLFNNQEYIINDILEGKYFIRGD